MKKLFTLLTALLLFATYGVAQLNGKLLITTKLTGDQEVPAVTTDAKGVASLLLSENHDSLFVNVSVAKLSGPITGIHIHEGAKGTNGGVKTNLTASINGNIISTVITGSSLTSEMIQGLIKGKYYLNVHTAANANGEIRGQLELEADWGFYGMLQGSQEVPSVSTTGEGWVAASLSKNKQMVHIWAVFRNTMGTVNAAHFYKAAMGANGSVVADLSSNIMGNTIQASIPASAFADDLIAGNIYLNVHSDMFPNGELRAQMMWSDHLNFVSWLDGAQEVPPTSVVGEGVAMFRLNAAMDSLWYDVIVDSTTGAITGAHLHDGAAGANGGVLINLSAGINGNMISGVATGFTQADIKKMMMGNVYVNIHTAANANGEVRGQLMSLTRTGFVAQINGLQEVPPVATLAFGSGIASFDVMNTNVHYMFVVNGLSGPITGAHFHNAAAGANGGVIYDMSGSFEKTGTSDAAFNYWTGNFTSAEAQMFLNNNVYVNIHTAANANGEIRGQMMDQGFVTPNTTGIFTPTAETVSVYPNPVRKTLYIDAVANSTIKVMDLQGKVLLEQPSTNFNDATVAVSVEGLEEGVYMINIETPNGLRVAKFIKN